MNIVRRAAVLATGQIVLRAVVAVYFLALVRLMSPAEFGDVSALMAMTAIAAVVADGGFSRLLMRDVARAWSSPEDVIGPMVLVRSIWMAFVIVVLVVGAVSGLLGDLTSSAVYLGIAVVGAESLAAGFEAASVGTEQPWRIGVGQFIAAAVLLVALGVLIGVGASPAGAMLGLLTSSVAKAAWQVMVWRRALSHGLDIPVDRVSDWVRQAAPFVVLALLGTLYYRVDLLILRAGTDAATTAPYGATYRIVDAILMLGGIGAAAVTARMSRLHGAGKDAVWQFWRRYCGWTVCLAAPTCLLLGLVANPLADILFGDVYGTESANILRLLTPGIFFMLLQIVNASVIFTADSQRWLIRMSLPQVAFNVALTLVLVNLFQARGAAAATSVSEVVTFAFWGLVIRRRYGPKGLQLDAAVWEASARESSSATGE